MKMEKINLPKEYEDLIRSSGETIEEILGVGATYTVECINCAIRCECDKIGLKDRDSCISMWTGYLMGVKHED